MTTTEKGLSILGEIMNKEGCNHAFYNGRCTSCERAEGDVWLERTKLCIHQAIAEDRARVRGLIEKLRKVLLKSDTENINPPTITLDGDYLHFYNQALDDLLASLDKTLTGKEVEEMPQMKGILEALNKLTIIK